MILFYCEARYDRSVSPWILSWMNVSPWILQNHVTIWWEEPDKWNKWKWIVNWVNFEELRSFVMMYLDEKMYSEEVIDKILTSSLIFN